MKKRQEQHQLTEAERARVCALLNQYKNNPQPVLQHAKRIIHGDRRAFLLTDEDKEDILSEYALRLHRNLDRALAARNPWAYTKTMIRRCVYDFVRLRRYKLHIVFRRGTRIKGLLELLRLNKAEIETIRRDDRGKWQLVVWTTASQAADLRNDPRKESLVVLHDGVHTVSVDDVSLPDPGDAALGRQVREDVESAHCQLKRDMPVPGEVFDLRLIQGLDWKSVAANVGFTPRHCRELLNQYLKQMRECFPELRDYLGDFGRSHT